jgi:hypothetical protein
VTEEQKEMEKRRRGREILKWRGNNLERKKGGTQLLL